MLQPARIALLGVGIMGQGLGERLLASGFALTVWNRTAAKAEDLGTRGAKIADSPSGAVHNADVVALCLTDKRAVEAVLFGEGGIAGALPPHGLILDFSTLGIAATRDFAARIANTAQCDWVDAPVSGGPSAARAGTLAIFCGGTQDAVTRATPILSAVSRVHSHMGAVGAGQATKLCNQLIVSAALMAIGEAMAAARALGLDAARLPQALAGGYADSLPLQIFGPRMASDNLVPRISEVATMRKDVKEVAAAIAGLPLDLRLTRAVEGLYDLAVERGLAGEDLGALVHLADRQS